MSHGSYDSNLGSEILILGGNIRSRSWLNIGDSYGILLWKKTKTFFGLSIIPNVITEKWGYSVKSNEILVQLAISKNRTKRYFGGDFFRLSMLHLLEISTSFHNHSDFEKPLNNHSKTLIYCTCAIIIHS